MPTQGPGGGLLSQNQRTAIPQVSWVSSGQGVTDLPFPKRLGVEFNGRDSPQSAERQISLQTTSAGILSGIRLFLYSYRQQVKSYLSCQINFLFSGQSQTRQYPDNVVRPSIGMTTCSLFNFLRSFL